jgi:hypothetical protein
VEVGTLDDFDADLSANGRQAITELGALITAVGVELVDEI